MASVTDRDDRYKIDSTLYLLAAPPMSDPSPAGATSPPRPRKRARKGTFRVAKDPSAKPVIATTVQLNQSGSSGSRLRVKRANAAVTIPPVDPSTPQAVSNTPQITGLNNQNINSAISTVVEHEDQAGPAIKRKRKYKYTTTSVRVFIERFMYFINILHSLDLQNG